MIAHVEMLVDPAKEAGIKVPDDVELIREDPDYAPSPDDYPHFFAYINMQIGRPLPYASSHWDNANIIAEISGENILTIDAAGIEALGYH